MDAIHEKICIMDTHNRKLASSTACEKLSFPRIIYKRSGLLKVAIDLVRATERSESSAPPPQSWKVAESMYKYLQTHRILKFSNYVLVRVPINNYNYEQLIALFVILLTKNTFTKHLDKSLSPTRPLLINIYVNIQSWCS